MTRITKAFNSLKKQGRKAFIPYIMAGDPSLERTKELVSLLEECGADIIELGVPFSDPVADGPTIQRAAERAIEGGVHLVDVIALVKDIRQTTQVPIVLMTYYNPVFKYGEEKFVTDAVEAGVDGVIIPDLPPEEAESLIKISRRPAHIPHSQGAAPPGPDVIFLLAPTSTPDRIKLVVKASRGFIYFVSITGITGAKLELGGPVMESIQAIRGMTKTPVAVGFGVKSPEEAAAVARVADGVIVGSEIVRRALLSEDSLREYLMSLRKAI